jgi:hypothetical protein
MLAESGGHVNYVEKRSGPAVTPNHRRRHSALGYSAPPRIPSGNPAWKAAGLGFEPRRRLSTV